MTSNTVSAALEFKGRMLSAMRARVLDADLQAIRAQLDEFARQMPRAVQGMPVIVEADAALDLAGVLAAMRAVGMAPIGVAEGALADAAQRLGVAVLPAESASRGRKAAKAELAPAGHAPAAPVETPPVPAVQPATVYASRLLLDPVRSGQQIYVPDGDLTVINAVSAGAEVVADGCVHVYGSLRGRAVAGARGNDQARVFCQRLEAELVAIAGIYLVAEQIPAALRGKPAQAYIENGRLSIVELRS